MQEVYQSDEIEQSKEMQEINESVEKGLNEKDIQVEQDKEKTDNDIRNIVCVQAR